MKKIILFVCVSCLFILSNIYAQDDFDDCFEVERLKAKSEGANTEDSINQAKEICNIKLNTGDDASESQNNPDFSEAEEVLFGKNTPETPGFTINFFNGNKEISGVSDSGLTTKGFLFTIPVSSRFSLTAGYLLSEGQISFTQTVAETYTETYVSGSTTSSQREMDPRPTYVGDAGDPGDEDSSRYYGSFCAFFRDWDSDGSLSSRDDCYGFATAREYALESSEISTRCDEEDFYVPIISHYYCFDYGDHLPASRLPSSSNTRNTQCYLHTTLSGGSEGTDCLIWEYTDTYSTVTGTRPVYSNRDVTQIVDRIVTENIKNDELSFGGRLLYTGLVPVTVL